MDAVDDPRLEAVVRLEPGVLMEDPLDVEMEVGRVAAGGAIVEVTLGLQPPLGGELIVEEEQELTTVVAASVSAFHDSSPPR